MTGLLQNTRRRMPVLFVGHGSPMNIIADNDFTRALQREGQALPLPLAVVVISAHWETRGTRVSRDEAFHRILDEHQQLGDDHRRVAAWIERMDALPRA